VGFLTTLFGGENNYLTMIVALAIVLALIVLAVWLLKLLGQTTRSLGRGRQKRLAIIDSISIDQKRQAVIVRRDEVEHLIVIGGPNDLVIESGFEAPPVPVAPARPARRMIPVPPVAAPEVREESSTPRSKPKSLRHTGLLRANDETGDELPGGKLEPTAAQFSDSDTSEAGAGLEPELETVAEAVDSDTADSSKGRRN
jgi:flagellar protein FliO/FliZ